MELQLSVKPAFQKLLRGLKHEEFVRLKANLQKAGKVREPIAYWTQGEKNWILDGHNRFEIANELGLKFKTEQVELESEHEARLWILENQLGKRNLTPDEFTLFVGQLYNESKGQERSPDGQFGHSVDPQNTAENIGKEHGVSEHTVRRAGKTAEFVDSLSQPLQLQIKARGTPPAALLKNLAAADSATQTAIAGEMRTGRETDWSKAAKKHGITAGKGTSKEAPRKEQGSRPPRSGTEKPRDYGICPNCKSKKWTEGDDGVSCAKCGQPHGEPTGGTDEDRIATQRSKTIKTAEALMRAFDDLHGMYPGPQHKAAIAGCKALLKIAKEWK